MVLDNNIIRDRQAKQAKQGKAKEMMNNKVDCNAVKDFGFLLCALVCWTPYTNTLMF